MSKMSQLHAALEEQLAELGFETLDQAAEAGYAIDYESQTLVRTCTRDDIGWAPIDQAHEDWAKEKRQLVRELLRVADTLDQNGLPRHAEVVDDAVDFIERSSM